MFRFFFRLADRQARSSVQGSVLGLALGRAARGVLVASLLWPTTVAALSPHAQGALRAGDCGPARAEAAATQSDAERLAVARCLIDAGESTAALAQIGAVDAAIWGDWARLLHAEALLAGGQAAAAAARLEGLLLPGAAAEHATLLRGRALIEAGQFEAGRAALSPMLTGAFGARGHTTRPGGADPAEVRWWLAADRRNSWLRIPSTTLHQEE